MFMGLYDILAWYIFLCLIYFMVLFIGQSILEYDKYIGFERVMVNIGMLNVIYLLYLIMERWSYFIAERKLFLYQEGDYLSVNDVKRWGIKEEHVKVSDTGEVVKWDVYARNKYKIMTSRPRF